MTLLVHVLPDFEMLGPGDTAKVIGAGVAVFGLERDIIVEGNRETGQPDALVQGTPFARLVYEAWPISVARQDVRTFDWDTVAWWSRQDPAVRSVAFEAMAGKGRALRLAVKEMIDAVLTLVHPEGALPANHGPTWSRIVWWAKPAAVDLSLWMSLLREFRPDLSQLYNRVCDANTLLSTVKAATGEVIAEHPRGPHEVHAPGSDALATADACARALYALRAARVKLDSRPAKT